MSSEKLEQMDEKLDKLMTGQAVTNEILSQLKKQVDDHDEVLYGKGTDKPGLIATVLDVTQSISKVRKIALGAVTALVGGLVTLVISLVKNKLFKGD